MATFYFNDKPLFTGKIESLEYEPNVSPLDLMDRSYLSNIELEAPIVLNVTNGILNEDIIKQMAKSKETIDPYTMTFNQRIIPNRKHRKKRIQKKWLKRYGY